MAVRRVGRPTNTSSERLAIFMDIDLKRRLAIRALMEGKTISQIISDLVRHYLAPKRRQPSLPGVESASESEQGETKSAPATSPTTPAPRERAPIAGKDEEV